MSLPFSYSKENVEAKTNLSETGKIKCARIPNLFLSYPIRLVTIPKSYTQKMLILWTVLQLPICLLCIVQRTEKIV